MACVRKRRGKWVIDFYDQFGDRHWETVGTNKKEAEERLAQRLLDIGKGQFIIPKDRKITFAELASNWLNGREGKIRPSTKSQYEDHVDKHLVPFFGPMRIGQIDIPRVDAYLAKKQKDTADLAQRKVTLTENAHDLDQSVKSQGRDLTPDERRQRARITDEIRTVERQQVGIATINKTVTTLGTILKYAVRAKLIESNPVPDVERPKIEAQEYSREDREMQIFTPEQIRVFLAAADPGLYRVLFATALMTGAREGELFGLQWGDIDWVSGQVLIRRSLSRNKDGWKFYEPKTRNSRRRVDVDPILLHELKKWKLMLPKSEPENLIFPSPLGEPLHRSTMYKQGFLPAIRRSGVPRIRFHDFRHTYASLLIAQGEHPKYIQMQLGHSSIKITMDVYGHLLEKVNVKSANRLARTVFGDVPDGTSSKIVAIQGTREPEAEDASKQLDLTEEKIAPDRTRTDDTRIRNPVLYPPELRGRIRTEDHFVVSQVICYHLL